jgi:uracil-DNA glycosylase family 4
MEPEEKRNYLQFLQDLYGDKFYLIPEDQAIKAAAPATAITEQMEATMSAEPSHFITNNTALTSYYEQINQCQKCPLGQTRNAFVFGSGNGNADLMLIGEAPGAEEDAQGLPFVGAAGKLLDKILAAINFKREDVFIANILKCRPPNNRDPQPAEVEQCQPYLNQQIELIKPKIILLLGRIAAQTLFQTKDSLTSMRGKDLQYLGIDVVVTYHPAALLRNPNWKRPTWDDIKKLRQRYDELTEQ